MGLNYRPEIDGLRALSILLVFVFHAIPWLCPGGYIGVDVFFVISGFLITKIICKNIENQSFSFLEFYHRRILRIFPALFFLLFGAILISFVTQGSRDYLEFLRACRFAAIQISNIYFAREVNYFEEGIEMSPLLHTWSLGVEEQFYLFWPVFLFFVLGFKKKTLRAFVLISTCLLSFILSAYWVEVSPNLAFYSMPSRLWELGLGGLIGLGYFPRMKEGIKSEALALLGLVLIVGSSFLLSGHSQFPGFNALAPVLGSALFIYAAPLTHLSKSLLSWGPIVFTGKISYSLYLWHWPIIVFLKTYTQKDLNPASALWVFFLSFLLAFISWKYVEAPFRKMPKKQSGFQWKVLGGGTLCVLIVVILSNGIKGAHDADFRYVTSAVHINKDNIQAFKNCNYGNQQIINKEEVYKSEKCSFNSNNRNERVIIFGDSHASHILPSFKRWAAQNSLNIGLMFSSSCPSFFGEYSIFQRNKRIERCEDFARYARQTILSDASIKTVVLSMRASQYTETRDNEDGQIRTFLVDSQSDQFSIENSRRVFRKRLEETIKEIEKAGKRVVIFGQVPMLQKDPIRCIENTKVLISHLFKVDEEHCFQFDWRWIEKRLASSQFIYKSLATKFNLQFLNPTTHIQSAKMDEKLIYFDDNHLNALGAEYYGSHIDIDSLLNN